MSFRKFGAIEERSNTSPRFATHRRDSSDKIDRVPGGTSAASPCTVLNRC